MIQKMLSNIKILKNNLELIDLRDINLKDPFILKDIIY